MQLGTGILIRDERILLVANAYPNRTDVLWNLPGGRQEPPELITATVVREFAEETSLDIRIEGLAYVAESFDRPSATHVTNVAFRVAAVGEPRRPAADAHVVDVAWWPLATLRERLDVAVIREPLLAYLADPQNQYLGFAEAGISITVRDEAARRPSPPGAPASTDRG